MATSIIPKLNNISSDFTFKNYKYGGTTISIEEAKKYQERYEDKRNNKENNYDDESSHKNNKKFTIEGLVDAVLKTGARITASYINTSVAFTKGLVSFGEGLVDTACYAIGGVISIVTAGMDIGNLISSKINGTEWSGFEKTKALWTDVVMPTIGENLTEKFFDDIYYNTEFGKKIDENAYSAFKKDGIGCKISESVGYYTGVVAVSMLTAGAGLATTSTSQGIVMGTAALGRNTQSAYNNLSEEEKHDAGALGVVAATSMATAAVEGLTYKFGVDAGTAAGMSALKHGSSKVASAVIKSGVQAGIKSLKPVVNETIEHYIYGTDWSGKEVAINVAGVVGSEIVGGVVENTMVNSITKGAQNIPTPFDQVSNPGQEAIESAINLDPDALSAFDEVMVYGVTEWSEGVTSAVIVDQLTE